MGDLTHEIDVMARRVKLAYTWHADAAKPLHVRQSYLEYAISLKRRITTLRRLRDRLASGS